MLFWFRSAERISKQENLRAVQNFMRVSYIAWWGTLLGLFLLASSVGNAQFTRDDWGRADEATVRLSPSTFLTLPSSVRTELERRECTIPQPYGERVQEMNVVSGKFTSTGETDWAVLCSRQKRSAILVFHGGRSNDVEELAEEPDLNYLQVISRGRKLGYSRQLAVAPPGEIRKHFLYRHRSPQKINHDGVEDTFIEKASTVWYHASEKWIRLSGAD